LKITCQKPYSDIWSPKQCDSLNYLLNEKYFDIPSLNKFSTFMETKVTAMKLQGFNLKIDTRLRIQSYNGDFKLDKVIFKPEIQ